VTPKAAKKTESRLAARLAAIASLGAAIIHFAVLPMHWQEWTAAGVFFAAIAIFQLVWASVAPVRQSAAVLASGIAVNVGAALMWALSRTAGAPFGPHAGQPEVVEAAGLCALLLECYVVLGASWAWHRNHRAEAVSGFGSAVVLSGASAVIAAAALVGVTSGLVNDHHAPAGAEHNLHTSLDEHDAHEQGHHEEAEPATAPRVDATTGPAPGPVQIPSSAEDSSHEGHHHGE
jgi:hypothetical protein